MKTNSRIGSYFVIAMALGVMSILVNVVSHLCLASWPGGVNLDALWQGRILHLFFIANFWEIYPSLPIMPEVLLHIPTAILTLDIAVFCVWLVRVRLGRSWQLTGLACLSAGAFLYLKGSIILANYSVTDDLVAGHLMSMMLGAIYSLVLCVACLFMDILRPGGHGSSQPAEAPSGNEANAQAILAG